MGILCSRDRANNYSVRSRCVCSRQQRGHSEARAAAPDATATAAAHATIAAGVTECELSAVMRHSAASELRSITVVLNRVMPRGG